jgi:hypothetical protein
MRITQVKCKPVGPGRCDHCGCLMVLVRLHDDLGNIEPLRRVGWRCLICDKIVDLHSLVNRHEPQPSTTSHRWHQRRGSQMRHVHTSM